MKSFMAEYGRMIVLSILLAIMFAFLWSRTESGYLGMLSDTKPKLLLKENDNVDDLVQLRPRPEPVLSVSVSKLEYQREYDLIHGKEIHASAADADGNSLPVCAINLVAPDGSVLEDDWNPEKFYTDQRGVYEITYQAEENYQGAYIKKVKKTCRFIVD